jgi:hypothetical protein
MRKAGIKVAPQQVTATSEAVQALVGEIAPYQAPAPPNVPSPSPPQHRPNAGGQRRRNSSRSPKSNPAPTESAISHRSNTPNHRSATPTRRVEYRRRSSRAQGAQG